METEIVTWLCVRRTSSKKTGSSCVWKAVAMGKRARRKHKRTLGEPSFDNFHEIDLNFNGSSRSERRR